MPRAIVLVLDSLGLGACPDAAAFGDSAANTLGHIAAWRHAQGQPLAVPNLLSLGLAHALRSASAVGGKPEDWPIGLPVAPTLAERVAFGAAWELSAGKDTPSGHWEMMGCPVPEAWGVFEAALGDPDTPDQSVFPANLMAEWCAAAGLAGTLGNCHASGTEILTRLGDEHIRTDWPICYTSADSVFQIAAHEELFGLQRLYQLCELAKPIFDRARIARVIARPFVGQNGHYVRTGQRRDYTTAPPQETLLDRLVAQGREVHAVGKIQDIFADRGITHPTHAHGNAALCQATLAALHACPDGGLVFANLVDFDTLYGHRRDVAGYATALEAFDAWLPQLQQALRPGDLLLISADHGCDPTQPGSDHTREHVPALFSGPACPSTHSIGLRAGFADLGQTLAGHLGVGKLGHGQACW